MSRFRVLVVAALAVVLVAGGILALRGSGSSDGKPSGKARAHVSGSTVTKGGSASSEIAPVQTFGPTATPSASAKAKGDGSGGSGSARLPGLSKVTKGALLTSLPQGAAKRGAVVRGYPTRIVPVVPRSTVRTSSVSPAGGRLQIALDATAGAKASDVLRFYAVELGAYGFRSAKAPAVGGSTASRFTRGQDSLVVTVTPGGRRGTCRYTVFGTLHAS